MVDTPKNELSFITHYINQNPKNKRRTRHKIVLENDSFELRFDKVSDRLEIAKKADLYFSIIPYDTSRKYIETACFIFIESQDVIDEYLKKHEPTIIQYIKLALFDVHKIKYATDSPEIRYELEKIAEDVYFKIQVAGRLMQHDETGPLSAALPFKFLYDLNMKTGIHGYIDELIRFYLAEIQQLPLAINGNQVILLDNQQSIQNPVNPSVTQLMSSNLGVTRKLSQKQLTKDQNNQIKELRRTYKAHSRHPKELQSFFDDVSEHSTTNKINVVSDIHSISSQILLDSPNFNIIAGDLSDGDSGVLSTNKHLNGIAVIGNHDILNYVRESREVFPKKLQTALVETTDANYSVLHVEDQELYQRSKKHLEKRFSGLKFLNNESFEYQGVRYIGLTVPVCYVRQRKQTQQFLVTTLRTLLASDQEIPTVLISHAPLFNELSLLSPQSSSYNEKHACVNQELADLFNEYNILGVIHGHHHLPASSGVIDFREFNGKKIFVACSIYSNLNSGFDLSPYLVN